MRRLLGLLFGSLVLIATLSVTACERPEPDVTVVVTPAPILPPPTPFITPRAGDASGGGVDTSPPTPDILARVDPSLPTYEGTPTPDPTRAAPTGPDGETYLSHTVESGETLNIIAQQYGATLEELMAINDLENNNFLQVGQVILVPGEATLTGPSFKIIPDSELVYGPSARDFNVAEFAAHFSGYLTQYQEEVEGVILDGPAVVQLVADRYSVNPRLLLAALEHRSGWVTQAAPPATEFPMQRSNERFRGLYKQLNWTADQINWGFYGRAEGGVTGFTIADGTRLTFAANINDGTAGLQHWLGAHDGATYGNWLQDVNSTGFFATYSRLFGNPFAYTIDPLLPTDIEQPMFTLPWAAGETWYFTGGPHGGWASGSAWAALDFVPHHEQLGCYPSDAWVRAMAPGVVTRSDFGAVVVDLDGDGYAGTGWSVLYMHLETRDRIAVGTEVAAGDPLGHPSCEGGFSNGTHVHIARTYNGRWISADGALPFAMGGWVSAGLGREYDGILTKGDVVKEACECRGDGNAVTAE